MSPLTQNILFPCLEGGADWLAEVRSSPAQDGQVVSELTEGDEGGERQLAGLCQDVGRVGHLARHSHIAWYYIYYSHLFGRKVDSGRIHQTFNITPAQ